MGELGVLFNPGMRHEQEEKLAKQMLREDEGTGRKGRLGIDLESGVVVIGSLSADPAAEPEVEGTAEPGARTEADASAEPRAGAEADASAEPDPSAGRNGAADAGHGGDTTGAGRNAGEPAMRAAATAAPSTAAATSTAAARKPQPGEARPARHAVKEAPAGKAKRKPSAPAAADAPVGKSRRRGR